MANDTEVKTKDGGPQKLMGGQTFLVGFPQRVSVAPNVNVLTWPFHH